MREESGVMIIRKGKAWGVAFENARELCYGWVDLCEAQIYDPEKIKRPIDAALNDSESKEKLKEGHIVKAKRVTAVEIDLEEALNPKDSWNRPWE